MLHWIQKVRHWYDHHQGLVDVGIGAGIGAGTGTKSYWEHFTDPETLNHFYDAIINTCLHTIIGAVLLWALHKYVFKTKKK